MEAMYNLTDMMIVNGESTAFKFKDVIFAFEDIDSSSDVVWSRTKLEEKFYAGGGVVGCGANCNKNHRADAKCIVCSRPFSKHYSE
jgi:hypothetical protein